MIPKLIHFYWEGEKMSWMRYMTLFSFRKMNPTWKMVLHVPYQFEKINYIWEGNAEFKGYWSPEKNQWIAFEPKDYWEKVKNLDIEVQKWDMKNPLNQTHSKAIMQLSETSVITPVQKSDFFSWDILSTEGGFYADMDILFVKPMDMFYDSVKAYDALVCFFDEMFPIGFLASSPNGALYTDILGKAIENFNSRVNESAGTVAFHRLIEKAHYVGHDKMQPIEKCYPRTYNIRKNVCYPWNCFSAEEIFISNHTTLPEETIAIHWYGGANISQKTNSYLNDTNFLEYNNTFCNFARKMYDT